MIQFFLRLLFSIFLIITFSSTANAAQLNLTLGDDLKGNQDLLNIAYDLYYQSGADPLDRSKESQSLNGFAPEHFVEWLQLFNKEIADKNPIDSIDGKHSQITLGYHKNGTDVFPASCQNMLLKEVTTILFTEEGCLLN